MCWYMSIIVKKINIFTPTVAIFILQNKKFRCILFFSCYFIIFKTINKSYIMTCWQNYPCFLLWIFTGLKLLHNWLFFHFNPIINFNNFIKFHRMMQNFPYIESIVSERSITYFVDRFFVSEFSETLYTLSFDIPSAS